MNYCDNCKRHIVRDAPMTVGHLVFDPRGDVTWRGQLVDISGAARIILHILLRARGCAVSSEALMQEVSEGHSNIVEVLISRMRRTFREIDPSFDRIETMRGVGYRWTA